MSDRDLATQRLLLRPYCESDLESIHRIWLERGVRRYLWDDKMISRETAAATIQSSVNDWSIYGYGQWTISLRESDAMIGFCGFRPAEWEPWPELLFGILSDYWGQGLASEAVLAALGFAFDQRGFHRVVAATDPPNHKSVRLLEGMGFRLDRRGEMQGLDTLFYSLRQAEFRESGG